MLQGYVRITNASARGEIKFNPEQLLSKHTQFTHNSPQMLVCFPPALILSKCDQSFQAVRSSHPLCDDPGDFSFDIYLSRI